MAGTTNTDLYLQYFTQDVLAGIVATSLNCLIIVNPEGRIMEVNPMTEKMFGRTHDELVGQMLPSFIEWPSDSPASSFFGDDIDRDSSKELRADVLLRSSSGRLFVLELTLFPSQQEGRLILLRDITLSKSHQSELQRTTARLHQLITNLQGGVLVEDETRHIVLVNEAFCAMFSVPAAPQQLIGADCSQSAEQTKSLFHNPEIFVRRIGQILQERQPVFGEILELIDGRVFSRDYAPVYHQDEYVGHLWHYHDVSKQFRAQKRWEHLHTLEEANREFIRLFLELDDPDIVLNEVMALAGHMLDVSRVFVFHFRENERILDNTHEWCAPGIAPEIENLKGLYFDTIVPSFFPLLISTGIIAPFHITELPDDIRAIMEPQSIQSVLILPWYFDGRLAGFIGFDEVRASRKWLPEEITTLRIIAESYSRALEREQNRLMLIEARDEALSTAKIRSQFVANTSHEIRTPLTGMLGMMELLLETSLDEMQHEFATEAYNSSLRLLRLINDLLDFSKLESGQVILEAAPLDLRAIATEIRMTLVPQIKVKPVEIQVEIGEDVPYRIYGDATRLRQVLLNLSGNAVKFTNYGSVYLGIHMISQVDNVAHLRFTVRDTGIGIAPQHLERIFDSFVQADGSTTRKYGGSGLGLAISQQLVGLMGDTIDVESVPKEGSTFSFSLKLPIAEAKGVGKETQKTFAALRVLVIDHNKTARYVLTQQLENWGVNVIHSDTIEGVLALIQNQDPYHLALVRSENIDLGITNPLFAYVQEIVAIQEKNTKSQSDESSHLTWPIDQSSLYNLLIKTSHSDVEAHQVPQPAQNQIFLGRILIADDNPVNVGLVKRALFKMNLKMDVVVNGQEVLEALEKEAYDLILMDIQMPILDGLEATRIIRALQTPYCNIPILALTASVMPSEQANYRLIGINDVISKPFPIKYLRNVVRQWLQKSSGTKSVPDAS